MLVVAPTRELACQSYDVIKEYASTLSLNASVVYGGVPKWKQVNELNKGVDIVVGTPGRLKDLVMEESCILSGVTQLVLDEADRMLGEIFFKLLLLEYSVRFVFVMLSISLNCYFWMISIRTIHYQLLFYS